MYSVSKNTDFEVNHNSDVLVPDLKNLGQNKDMENFDWQTVPMKGTLNLGPFTVYDELHIDSSNLVDSSFKVKVSANVPYIGNVTLTDGTLDKDHVELGFDKYGFKVQTLFEVNNLEVIVRLAAYGHMWEHVIWKK